ncbi:MAG: protein translocase subunit SecD [Actinomycetota bacterium]|nr:protein translocase subunit SecD [Actinomycetota bacterium]MDH5223630.1 protein translocase subunit SecD [Actinomycetota bacterium]MDH5313540.1 protein translocase subunit SecD [Actinomycetota bacterium]
MKRTRGLWVSIIFVLVLTLASLVGFATGALQPILGLDLEGGVSVTLSAPDGTPGEVMERARTNISNRVDAFGVGEPDIAVSGSTIEVQIPGLAQGSIEERSQKRYCLVSPEGENYGCSETEQAAADAFAELTVVSQVAEACLVDDAGTQVECFPTAALARAGKAAITVAPRADDGATAAPSPSAAPPPGDAKFCLVSQTGEQLECYGSRKEATAAQESLRVDVTEQTYCVTDGGAATDDAQESPSPTPSAEPSISPSASPSPAAPTAFSGLSLGANQLPCGLASRSNAQAAADEIDVRSVDTLYCVVSSAEQDLGCFIDRASAEERQRSTGQQRLLDVIGQTARLEERPVLAIVPPADPAYAATPVTCPTPEEREAKECSFATLRDQAVVYEDDAGNRFRLGPAVIVGGDIADATAVLGGATGSEWTVQFRLTGDATGRFADATTAAVSLPPPQNQIAIVVDRAIVSAPTVQSPIAGGTGDITGGFNEAEARDLATVLNAGALPVELTRQQVQTVSPTLGSESLRQGIIAGVVGLVLLLMYLLFYYRLLGIVAWFGMSIWAVLAIALISLAGIQFGYALTLAGVAGLVISLGVTADSYIVFFERLKDEVRSGKTARAAVQPAFARSYKTIIAADVVAGIAAVVLYLTAVSSVRGFALTLGVATLLDLFVVYFFKRPTVFLVARNQRLVSLKGFGLEAGVAGEKDEATEGARP